MQPCCHRFTSAATCCQSFEGFAVVEAEKRLVGYGDLEEVTQRLPALPDLVDQQPVAGYVASHVLGVPLEVGDSGVLTREPTEPLGYLRTFGAPALSKRLIIPRTRLPRTGQVMAAPWSSRLFSTVCL